MQNLIVGGGIAGLSLARALERCGIVADLFERQPDPPAGARCQAANDIAERGARTSSSVGR